MVTVDDLARIYLAGYSNPQTLANKRRYLDSFLAKLAAARLPIGEVTAPFVEQHIRDEARGKGWTDSTVRSAQIELRLFLSQAYEHGLTPKDISQQIRVSRPPERALQHFYTLEQSQQILAAAREADPSVNRAIHLALLSGLRRGDIMGARASHLRTDGTRTLLYLPYRKGGRSSTISLPEPTLATLPAKGPFITYSASTLANRVRALGESLGLPAPLWLHSLRASFITHALDAGVSERDVMLAAGHKHLTTTAYYDQGYKVARVGVGEAVAERLKA